ncbi:hypothetical protein BX600DRAFT_519420 [Xylariales sp. PMI_506]|nr:hypothetical protein BX600DRAFT_519420 [Xylariales sp. PMI_506]
MVPSAGSPTTGISDSGVRAYLSGGGAYSHISAAYITSLAPDVRDHVVQTYAAALRVVWIVCLAFSALGFVLVFLEREIKLRRKVEGDFKLKDKGAKAQQGLDTQSQAPTPKYIDLEKQKPDPATTPGQSTESEQVQCPFAA